MNRIEYYIHCLTHLHRAVVKGGAPHKPILLLSVIDSIEQGYITDERIYITPELVTLFQSNWKLRVRSDHVMNFALPFYHMSSEPFWKLATKPGYEIELTTSRSIKSFNALNRAVDYALIDRDLFILLSDVVAREVLKQSLVEKYFSILKQNGKGNVEYLYKIKENILHDVRGEYLIGTQLGEEVAEEDRFLRNGVFSRTVQEVYNNTCCITGLSISSALNISMLDACHIVPFSKTHNDTIGNGLALCPNLHRAFDRGLITINEDYRVVVSRLFNEQTDCSHSIRQFENKRINLPQEQSYYPNTDNLRWHNNNIFKK